MIKYELTPGDSAQAPIQWTDHTSALLSKESSTLIMFVHPQCPCTRSSLTQLSELMRKCGSKLKPYVLLLSPSKVPQGWNRLALMNEIQAIPGITVLPDPDGAEARRFSVVTSGQTLIYGRDGRLIFSGGLTAARGETGSYPLNIVHSLIESNRTGITKLPVFGCPLFSREQL